MLRAFETDLATLSFNIETLLEDSLTMNTKLKNVKVRFSYFVLFAVVVFVIAYIIIVDNKMSPVVLKTGS
jgi:hypothetical protein